LTLNIFNFRDAIHKCNLCDEVCNSFALFTKHINSDKHRSLMTKWICLDLSEESNNTGTAKEKVQPKNLIGTEELRNKGNPAIVARVPTLMHQPFSNFPLKNQYNWTNPNISNYSSPSNVGRTNKEFR